MKKEKNEFGLVNNKFYALAMKTKKGKTLYLKSNKDKFEWTFDYNECIWWDTAIEVEKFATDYFKNFKEWIITPVYA